MSSQHDPANIDFPTVAFYDGKNCFTENRCITRLVVANGMDTIEQQAFENCTGLTSLYGIPDTVVSLGAYAFASCSSLTSLEGLPKTCVG